MSIYPTLRLRRLRRTENIRRLVRETTLTVDRLIQPLFVTQGSRKEITALPGYAQLPVEEAVEEARGSYRLGIPAVLLFGIPAHKDELGSAAWDDQGVVQQTVRRLKEELPGLVVITDVCLCEYTSHGHCGRVIAGEVENDATVELLVREAVSHARAGADIVAPSDMMDGRVGAIREGLDEEGFSGVLILSYAAKYFSAFYGPFREAAESAPQFGDRSTYQMDPGQSDEALREIWLDIEEGADLVMVKPALPYLDIIYRVSQETRYPVCAYHVSGEYAMVKAATRNGWLDGRRAMKEVLTAIRRAGADMIITYFAREAAELMHRGEW